MKIHDTVFLNTFSKEDVLRVYDKIVAEKLAEINLHQSIPRVDAEQCECLQMSYDPSFNMVYLFKYDSKVLFTNTECVCLIASESKFLKMLKPNEQYKKIMEQ